MTTPSPASTNPSPTFTGTYERSVDAKGRFALPFRFRREDPASETYFVTPNLDGALAIFPRQVWERTIQELQERATGREGRARLRRFSASSYKLVPDAQGRVSVPVELLRAHGITRRGVVVGMGRYMELWSPDRVPAELTRPVTVEADPADEEFLKGVF